MLLMASLRASTDFSRPTSKWRIILGKSTSPRRASTGISSASTSSGTSPWDSLGRGVTFLLTFFFSSIWVQTTFPVRQGMRPTPKREGRTRQPPVLFSAEPGAGYAEAQLIGLCGTKTPALRPPGTPSSLPGLPLLMNTTPAASHGGSTIKHYDAEPRLGRGAGAGWFSIRRTGFFSGLWWYSGSPSPPA